MRVAKNGDWGEGKRGEEEGYNVKGKCWKRNECDLYLNEKGKVGIGICEGERESRGGKEMSDG